MKAVLICAALVCATLGGCGQTGALYLPDKGGEVVSKGPADIAAAPDAAPAPAAAPASATAAPADAAADTEAARKREQSAAPNAAAK